MSLETINFLWVVTDLNWVNVYGYSRELSHVLKLN